VVKDLLFIILWKRTCFEGKGHRVMSPRLVTVSGKLFVQEIAAYHYRNERRGGGVTASQPSTNERLKIPGGKATSGEFSLYGGPR